MKKLDVKPLVACWSVPFLRAVDAYKAFAEDLKAGKMAGTRIDECRALIDKCLEHEPNFARAYALLSGTYMTKWAIEVDDEFLNPKALEKALVAVEKAIRIEPEELHSRAQYAHVLSFLQRRDRAYAEYKAAIKRNPHFIDWRFTSVCISAGRPQEAVKVGEMLQRADPFAPSISLYFLGMAHYLVGRYDLAESVFFELVGGSSNFAITRRMLAACLAQLGKMDEARAHADATNQAHPDWWISKDFVPSIPHFLPEQIDRVVQGMTKAGIKF